jgi:hypothetical protein
VSLQIMNEFCILSVNYFLLYACHIPFCIDEHGGVKVVNACFRALSNWSLL